MATYTRQHCGKDYQTTLIGRRADRICKRCLDKGLPWSAARRKSGPETDFIVERVEEKPPKIPQVLVQSSTSDYFLLNGSGG